METIFFLVDRIKKVKNVEKIAPVDFFRGCNKYVVAALDHARDTGVYIPDFRSIMDNADYDTDYTLHDR